MADKNFLTKEGYEKLLEELKENRAKLPHVIEKIKEAIEQGDISENAEYSSSVDEKNLVEARISEIEDLISNVEIIKESKKKGGDTEIRYGSKIKLNFDDGKIFDFTVVGTGEVDILNNTISFESPLGKAIRGKKVGEVLKIKAPHKKYEVKILEIQ